MSIDKQKAWSQTLEVLKTTKSFDLEQHINLLSTSILKIRLYDVLDLAKCIFKLYEQSISNVNNALTDEDSLKITSIILLNKQLIKSSISGDNEDIHGFKSNIEMFFNRREFKKNKLNKVMIAEAIYICITEMAVEIQAANNLEQIKQNCSPETAQFFDLDYILSELLEIPNKYRILAV